jgi:hypothetical protein
MEIAEEKERGMGKKEEWINMKKFEGVYPKLQPVIDEMSELFIVNVDTETDNSSSDTESTNDGEMSGIESLDS